MTDTRLWDRAAAVPAPVDGRRFAAVAALPSGLPEPDQLFEFMDACKPEINDEIKEKMILSGDLEEKMRAAITEFKQTVTL